MEIGICPVQVHLMDFKKGMECAMQGDCTVTYDDAFSAASAVEWFNGKDFKGMLHQQQT